MSGVNMAIIMGRLGNDPELSTMPNGNSVVNLSVATSEQWKDKQTGEKKEATEWHKCVAFGNTANFIKNYAQKGSTVHIIGRIRTRGWEKDGVKRYATEIIVDSVELARGDSSGNGKQQSAKVSEKFDDTNFDDDIPF